MLHTSLQLIIMFLLKRSNGASGHSFIIALKRCRKILKTTWYFFLRKCQWNKRVMKIPLRIIISFDQKKTSLEFYFIHLQTKLIEFFFLFKDELLDLWLISVHFDRIQKKFKLAQVMASRLSGKWLYKDLPLRMLGSQCYRG